MKREIYIFGRVGIPVGRLSNGLIFYRLKHTLAFDLFGLLCPLVFKHVQLITTFLSVYTCAWLELTWAFPSHYVHMKRILSWQLLQKTLP